MDQPVRAMQTQKTFICLSFQEKKWKKEIAWVFVNKKFLIFVISLHGGCFRISCKLSNRIFGYLVIGPSINYSKKYTRKKMLYKDREKL